jgi:hypothetical protein
MVLVARETFDLERIAVLLCHDIADDSLNSTLSSQFDIDRIP